MLVSSRMRTNPRDGFVYLGLKLIGGTVCIALSNLSHDLTEDLAAHGALQDSLELRIVCVRVLIPQLGSHLPDDCTSHRFVNQR